MTKTKESVTVSVTGSLFLYKRRLFAFSLSFSDTQVMILMLIICIFCLMFRYTGHGFDVDRTLKSCDFRHPVILLAHQPHAAKAALDSSYRVDLVLSGKSD